VNWASNFDSFNLDPLKDI